MDSHELIQVMIVDDHELVRIGLHTILKRLEGITVVGVSVDGESAVSTALALKPHVVLMDIGLPVFDGIEASRRIKQECPEIKILILTAYEREQHVTAAFAAGADGYMQKTITKESLVNAIQAVHLGSSWLDPTIAALVLRQHPSPQTDVSLKSSSRVSLSEQEQAILNLMSQGLSHANIAERQNLSTQTLRAHIRSVMEKLEISDRTQAAAKALRLGTLDKKI
jgi:DNA-binding NarL/FixJ family response regulator